MIYSVTKSIQIGRPADVAYGFIADPATMPQWAVHNVKSIRPASGGRWEMETPRGPGWLVPRYEKAHGILDHEFLDAGEGRWQVAARIVPISASDSVYMITLTRPQALPVEAFEMGMKLMDDELAALKSCVEAL